MKLMKIDKIKIVNFKCYYGDFIVSFNNDLNIIVGNNEAGKSTILEAIHLALTGFLNGRNIQNELTQYLFNKQIVSEYIDSIKSRNPIQPPIVLIEVFFSGDDEEIALYRGDGNSLKEDASGIAFKILFDEKYREAYKLFIDKGEIISLPLEYYGVSWSTFARKDITPRNIDIKSTLIDSSNYRYQNGSDVYVSKIIKDNLNPDDIVNISQAHRRMREGFMQEEAVKCINNKINNDIKLTDKEITLSVELTTKNAWESNLVTELDEIPFHFVGKGTQCIAKTELALSTNRARNAGIILIEEPENHLSHSNLNQFISCIKESFGDKQIIMTTHSSFVANKLGLDKLILIDNFKPVKFNDLKSDTKRFFQKISGYDTLRFVLSNKVILVEGDSDELVVQKAYLVNNNGKLPIENGIDIISVGLSFLRFLELAEKLKKDTTVITDNDGDIDALKRKYAEYINENTKSYIRIVYDPVIDVGEDSSFNYNTLEPKMLKENGLDKFNVIFNKSFNTNEEMLKYMKLNKTDCALAIFETESEIQFPNYILEGIKNE